MAEAAMVEEGLVVAAQVGAQVVGMAEEVTAGAACTKTLSTRASHHTRSPCHSMRPPPMQHIGASPGRGTRGTPQ